ncbi:TetR/AcrR family transcriptional regulator [Solihabitans fulvus]|uniref:TetR/AcrR family transcriptional regulator n=1 Tax=Solihabitans fulvus TaxID=1892852 RepID=A0A5B2XVQ6_9PSEU|nr:TetR/AcrR family transcriptional regulator [Solihabitans fulvus]KAA2266972.1 TetR/AcrR family transcriptional regulator [Solihabitans fulvus]
MATTDEPAMRADARRNYERVLAAARAVFAVHGTEASLRDVARTAGVGIGTLYRHFPTREALLEALLRNEFEQLSAKADGLLADPSPDAALVSWLRDFATGSTTYQGLPASVLAALHDDGSELHAACLAMREVGARLLARAQEAGTIRADLDIGELFALTAALAWVNEQVPGEADVTDRFLTLVMEGLRR